MTNEEFEVAMQPEEYKNYVREYLLAINRSSNDSDVIQFIGLRWHSWPKG